jgi:hypothetical protein
MVLGRCIGEVFISTRDTFASILCGARRYEGVFLSRVNHTTWKMNTNLIRSTKYYTVLRAEVSPPRDRSKNRLEPASDVPGQSLRIKHRVIATLHLGPKSPPPPECLD